jgi:hypothetical protein
MSTQEQVYLQAVSLRKRCGHCRRCFQRIGQNTGKQMGSLCQMMLSKIQYQKESIKEHIGKQCYWGSQT